jgi:hypothetical protein
MTVNLCCLQRKSLFAPLCACLFVTSPTKNDQKRVQVKRLKGEVSSGASKLQKAEGQLKEQAGVMGSLTPRPSWRALHSHGIQEAEGKRTQVRE